MAKASEWLGHGVMLDTGQLQISGNTLLSFRQGLAAAAEEQYEQAIAHFHHVLEASPDFYEGWYERGLALERLGDYEAAIASYDRALSLNPKDDAACEIWHDRGNALQYGLGDYQSALICYVRALQIKPNHELAWQNRGNALLYGLNNAREALTCYNHVITINADNPLAWRNRGNALAELQHFDAAIASYEKAIELKPDDQVAWHAHKLVSEKSGLKYREPTTNPAWYGTGYNDSTFVEGETDTDIIFSPDLSTTTEMEERQTRYPCLQVEDDSGKRDILLDQDCYRIGRDPDSDICLHSRFASRYHAVLTRISPPEGQAVYQVTDGSIDGKPSTNGLIVNGHRCQTWTLQAEDVIVFGPQVRAVYRLLPAHALQSSLP